VRTLQGEQGLPLEHFEDHVALEAAQVAPQVRQVLVRAPRVRDNVKVVRVLGLCAQRGMREGVSRAAEGDGRCSRVRTITVSSMIPPLSLVKTDSVAPPVGSAATSATVRLSMNRTRSSPRSLPGHGMRVKDQHGAHGVCTRAGWRRRLCLGAPRGKARGHV
jgi:hypothetical protein